MHSKTIQGEIVLLCRRYFLHPPICNPNSSALFLRHRNLNFAPSSQNGRRIPDYNLPSSSPYFNFHFAPTAHSRRRSLLIDSPGKVNFSQFFTASIRSICRKACAQHSPVKPNRLGRRNSRSCKLVMEPKKLAEIVQEISSDSKDIDTNLDKLNFMLSPSTVAQILCALNARGHSAKRFTDWVLNYHSNFNPNSEIYNLIVDNLGRLEDYTSMHNMLNELSNKGHCLTEKAFTFMKFCSPSTMKESVRRVTQVLNSTGGSSRNSGIYSLIKLLCDAKSFDLASLVMAETARKASYYNLLIAAKCRHGDFREAFCVLHEMKTYACDPNISSYNYLLGSLFKHNRAVEACDLLQKMEEAGCVPDLITYEVVVTHACKAYRMDYAIEVLNLMFSKGLNPRPTTHAAFIKGFFLSGRVENAYDYVIEMSEKDLRSKNLNYSLLASLFRSARRVVEAYDVLREMMQKGLKPNFPVYVRVLKDLHSISRGDLASELKSMFSRFNMNSDAG
ncbi:hypothetical protein KSP40_PGU022426 [Platanthera guangdongensis]|uniref:Pentatricopeptide repeat-containing protein n=1 Tax=Platanthera guangdongensis TaxID=2320717 RepID=A0ABR2LQB3_9ASPA